MNQKTMLETVEAVFDRNKEHWTCICGTKLGRITKNGGETLLQLPHGFVYDAAKNLYLQPSPERLTGRFGGASREKRQARQNKDEVSAKINALFVEKGITDSVLAFNRVERPGLYVLSAAHFPILVRCTHDHCKRYNIIPSLRA